MGVGRQGLFEREVAQNGEDEVSGGSESGFHGCAAKLKQGIAFVEMPGQAGADGYSTLEAFFWRRVFHLEASGLIRGEMRVKDKQDAAIVLARKFPHHQRTVARGGLPVNVTRAVRRDVIAKRVKVLATALRQTFESSLDARQDFKIFFSRSHGWIDESFRFQIEVAGFLQESKWKASGDAEGFLTINATSREGHGDDLLHAVVPWEIGKINGRLQHRRGRSGPFCLGGFDAEGERWQRQFFI